VTDLRTLQASYDVIDEYLNGDPENTFIASRDELLRIRAMLARMIEEAKSVNPIVSEEV
jgi:hypothetical protein